MNYKIHKTQELITTKYLNKGDPKMKNNNDISSINERLDSIENILRLLVVNSLTDSLNTLSSDTKEIQEKLPDELTNRLKESGFACIDSEVRNGKKIIFIETENNNEISDFLELNKCIKSDYSIIPVFSFKNKKIHRYRRISFLNERISFVTKKEIHIYTEL
jgi:hypothetical protein